MSAAQWSPGCHVIVGSNPRHLSTIKNKSEQRTGPACSREQIRNFKGTASRDLLSLFLHDFEPRVPLIFLLKYILIWFWFRGGIRLRQISAVSLTPLSLTQFIWHRGLNQVLCDDHWLRFIYCKTSILWNIASQNLKSLNLNFRYEVEVIIVNDLTF